MKQMETLSKAKKEEKEIKEKKRMVEEAEGK